MAGVSVTNASDPRGPVTNGASTTCSNCSVDPNRPATALAYSSAALEGSLKSIGTRMRLNIVLLHDVPLSGAQHMPGRRAGFTRGFLEDEARCAEEFAESRD